MSEADELTDADAPEGAADPAPSRPGPERAPRPGGRRKTMWAALVVAGVLGVAGLFAVLARDEPEARRDAPRPLPVAPRLVDPEAQELVAVLAKGRDRTLHLRYRAAGEEAAKGGISIELWRKGQLVRHDTEVRVGDEVQRSAAFQRPEGVVSCRQRRDEPWRCARVGQPAGTGTDALVEQVVGDLEGRDVSVRDDEIGGRRVRCFTLTAPDQTSELCATPEGVPVRLTAKASALELVDMDDRVDDGVFVPPVAPTD